MPDQSATSPHIADPAPDPIASERVGRHGAWLAEFGELVMRASRAVAGEIEAAAPGRPLGSDKPVQPSPLIEGLTRSLVRLGRSLRMTCALETRLDDERKGLARQARERRVQAQRRVERDAQDIVDTAVERAESVREALETLIEARPEREREDLYDRCDDALRLLEALDAPDILKRPVSAWITETCETLNLVPRWDLFEDEPWAEEEAEARIPGALYVKRAGSTQARPPRRLPGPGESAAVKGPP